MERLSRANGLSPADPCMPKGRLERTDAANWRLTYPLPILTCSGIEQNLLLAHATKLYNLYQREPMIETRYACACSSFHTTHWSCLSCPWGSPCIPCCCSSTHLSPGWASGGGLRMCIKKECLMNLRMFCMLYVDGPRNWWINQLFSLEH